MGYRKVSACMDCAECVSCSRYGRYTLEFYCDRCDQENVELYEVNGNQVCEDCAAELLATKKKGVCEYCEETDYLFEIDGKKVCLYCFPEYLQEIDEELMWSERQMTIDNFID